MALGGCWSQTRQNLGILLKVTGNQRRIFSKKNVVKGVPVVAPWLTNPTTNHEVAASVPALAQWVNDPALP